MAIVHRREKNFFHVRHCLGRGIRSLSYRQNWQDRGPISPGSGYTLMMSLRVLASSIPGLGLEMRVVEERPWLTR